MDCVECTLPITEYRQYIQSDPDICEACYIIVQGGDDMDKTIEDIEKEYGVQAGVDLD